MAIVGPLTDLIRALAVVYRCLPGYEAPQHGLGILALRRPEVCRLRAIGGEVVHEDMPAGVWRVTGTPKRGAAAGVNPWPEDVGVQRVRECRVAHGLPLVWLTQFRPLQ